MQIKQFFFHSTHANRHIHKWSLFSLQRRIFASLQDSSGWIILKMIHIHRYSLCVAFVSLLAVLTHLLTCVKSKEELHLCVCIRTQCIYAYTHIDGLCFLLWSGGNNEIATNQWSGIYNWKTKIIRFDGDAADVLAVYIYGLKSNGKSWNLALCCSKS